MTKHINYKTQSVCSRAIEIDVENDVITKVKVVGGCAGNTQGVASLIRGMSVDEAISRLEGIRCGFKPTSCPDQLSKALKQAKEEQD